MLVWSISVLFVAAVDLLAMHLQCEVWVCSQRFRQESCTVQMCTCGQCVGVYR